jgi:hypothetical protein
MFALGYTELYHPGTHGFDELSSPCINNHYMTILKIKDPTDYLSLLTDIDNPCINYRECMTKRSIGDHREMLFHIQKRSKMLRRIPDHPCIRNFLRIQETLLYPSSLHIVHIHELPGGESICILKTFWLKCIQRKWKKICRYNNDLVNDLKRIHHLKKREITHCSKKLMGIQGLWYKSL